MNIIRHLCDIKDKKTIFQQSRNQIKQRNTILVNKRDDFLKSFLQLHIPSSAKTPNYIKPSCKRLLNRLYQLL